MTQSQYVAVTGVNPADPIAVGLGLPVQNVSYQQAQDFCARLGRREGRAYRLPTESEWEYACRAGTGGAYAGDLPDMAWYDGNSDNRLQAVGRKRPNAWGLYDMHGLVNEWCSDWYGPYPPKAVADPQGATEGHHRVIRGGDFSRSSRWVRSAARAPRDPELPGPKIGFRVVCEAAETP